MPPRRGEYGASRGWPRDRGRENARVPRWERLCGKGLRPLVPEILSVAAVQRLHAAVLSDALHRAHPVSRQRVHRLHLCADIRGARISSRHLSRRAHPDADSRYRPPQAREPAAGAGNPPNGRRAPAAGAAVRQHDRDHPRELRRTRAPAPDAGRPHDPRL